MRLSIHLKNYNYKRSVDLNLRMTFDEMYKKHLENFKINLNFKQKLKKIIRIKLIFFY